MDDTNNKSIEQLSLELRDTVRRSFVEWQASELKNLGFSLFHTEWFVDTLTFEHLSPSPIDLIMDFMKRIGERRAFARECMGIIDSIIDEARAKSL